MFVTPQISRHPSVEASKSTPRAILRQIPNDSHPTSLQPKAAQPVGPRVTLGGLPLISDEELLLHLVAWFGNMLLGLAWETKLAALGKSLGHRNSIAQTPDYAREGKG